ncbi:MAG: hypothetical protein M0T70_04405 [Geobacteraceae bacterium]|nr:hypothetical protein [Geobacteraceae bacterium]
MKSNRIALPLITVGVCLFAATAIVQAFTANGKRVVTEGDPITLFRTLTSARTVTETEKAHWTFNNASTLRKFGEAGGAPTFDGGAMVTTISGNAISATKLQTARTINGVAFDGTGNITVADSTKSPLAGPGNTQSFSAKNYNFAGFSFGPFGVVNSESSIYTLLDPTVAYGISTNLGGGLDIMANQAGQPIRFYAGTANNANPPEIAEINSGGLSVAGTITAPSLSGNAGSATKLQTARSINGVLFDGTAAITINAVDSTAREPAIAAGTIAQYYRGDKSWQTLPTTLPASDVYAWAKTPAKPAYTYSEVGADPAGAAAAITSITGNAGSAYQIINNGALGLQSVTPGTAYSNAVCVRETLGFVNYTSAIYAPRLGFHWAGIVASSIGLDRAGDFHFNDNPGTGLSSIYARSGVFAGALTSPTIYADTIAPMTSGGGVAFVGPISSGAITAPSLSGNAATATTAAGMQSPFGNYSSYTIDANGIRSAATYFSRTYMYYQGSKLVVTTVPPPP